MSTGRISGSNVRALACVAALVAAAGGCLEPRVGAEARVLCDAKVTVPPLREVAAGVDAVAVTGCGDVVYAADGDVVVLDPTLREVQRLAGGADPSLTALASVGSGQWFAWGEAPGALDPTTLVFAHAGDGGALVVPAYQGPVWWAMDGGPNPAVVVPVVDSGTLERVDLAQRTREPLTASRHTRHDVQVAGGRVFWVERDGAVRWASDDGPAREVARLLLDDVSVDGMRCIEEMVPSDDGRFLLVGARWRTGCSYLWDQDCPPWLHETVVVGVDGGQTLATVPRADAAGALFAEGGGLPVILPTRPGYVALGEEGVQATVTDGKPLASLADGRLVVMTEVPSWSSRLYVVPFGEEPDAGALIGGWEERRHEGEFRCDARRQACSVWYLGKPLNYTIGGGSAPQPSPPPVRVKQVRAGVDDPVTLALADGPPGLTVAPGGTVAISGRLPPLLHPTPGEWEDLLRPAVVVFDPTGRPVWETTVDEGTAASVVEVGALVLVIARRSAPGTVTHTRLWVVDPLTGRDVALAAVDGDVQIAADPTGAVVAYLAGATLFAGALPTP
jgi:hypothetical protein